MLDGIFLTTDFRLLRYVRLFFFFLLWFFFFAVLVCIDKF